MRTFFILSTVRRRKLECDLPVRAVRSVGRVGSHFEMVKDNVDLFVGSGDENVGAIRA